ncbi:unnamed protein product [Fusarium graminearum]|uniref:Polyprenal reductase n=1 Tax=Gibberella zeae TaxID=5518 RepID=A0A4U9F552_GIBZA|nr:hypothetical protein FG05_07239 [Fusarium graminearum]CAF3444534.1 unnamed protein product [Fusarium graminearum]CAF3460856.1 unnamed protein product [Fusarium graminearum]CAF3617499.1 unnamed protein product [Fusarium graminearum]CAG1960018.1 unnamed protein product [Fusarium graminearum]
MAELLHQSIDLVSNLTPVQCCQTFFALSTAIVLGIQALPQDVRSALMDYGARRPKDAKHEKGREENKQKVFVPLRSFMKNLTEYGQVPHSWFLHFYIVSVALSGFWAWQYLTKGHVLRTIATWQDRAGGPSMSLEQIFVAWLLMALQGSRRLYESLFVFKPGSSPMWFIHWALGLSYYIAMSLAVWVEGSSAILAAWDSPHQPLRIPRRLPSALALYFVAYFKQNQCHRHLASLKKYTLPSEGWFRYIICPHYTSECLVYLAIAWIAAPHGQLFNKSILGAVIFVAVNLGATAKGTKAWYEQKFGVDKVAGRWLMIPPVY